MGIESFFLKIKVERINLINIEAIIKSKKLYQDALNYYIDQETKAIVIQASLVCFYSMCDGIFKLCTELNKKGLIKSIESIKSEKIFNFEDSIDFLYWMYTEWKDKLIYFQENWGIFAVKPSNYYKARRKLGKRYFFNL